MALKRGSSIRDEDDGGEHRRQEDDADGRDRRLATELQQQPGSDSAAPDPAQVANPVGPRGVTALRRSTHTGEQALARRLRRVVAALKPVAYEKQPPVLR